MALICFIKSLISNGVWLIIIVTIVLMLLRLVVTYADPNPFSWFALNVRRITDPFVNPVRRALMGFGADPKYAPLITILLAILLGYFAIMLASGVLDTVRSVMYGLQLQRFGAVIGSLLYGLLGIYSLFIFIRIIFMWGMVSYANPVMRFLVRVTDPLLVPLRRIVPPLGMMDLSPLVAFFIIWLFQGAIQVTMLGNFGPPSCGGF